MDLKIVNSIFYNAPLVTKNWLLDNIEAIIIWSIVIVIVILVALPERME